MSKLKIFGLSVGGLAAFLVIMFILGFYGLGWFKFFGPKKENIRREIFENTQSYIHGKIQDLAKYYDEYNSVDVKDREAIRQIIIMRFAEFDETKVKSQNLKNFLIKMRGY